MKIAFVTTNLKGGGAEKSVLRLAEGLCARGHSVHVVLLENRTDHAVPSGVELHALTAPGEEATKGWLGKRLAARSLRRLFGLLSGKTPFDLIVSTLPYCDDVVTLAGLTPAWYRIANTLSVEIELLARRSRRKAERRLLRYREIYDGRNLVAVSDGVVRDLSEALGLQRANVVRIHNAVDAAAVRRLSAEHEPALPREPYLIHVGRFVPQKRHDLLLDALRLSQLPHRLVLLANSSTELDQLIADRGLAGRVTIAGFQRNPYPWIAGAELLVLCSDHEGMPNVLLEALACGTRIVSTDCPSGPREVMEGDLAHYLVPCGDADALAAAMRSALAAPRPEAQDVLARFAPEAALSRYESLPGLWRAIG
jgi:glycosyltransferase involved in cell wall biosynthesis